MDGMIYQPRGCAGGWEKVGAQAQLGGALGTVFDNSILYENGVFHQWFSWRPTRSIAYCQSTDGVHWSNPRVVLLPDPASTWERDDVNRPCVVRRNGVYQMWYIGQMRTVDFLRSTSGVGYAFSYDGLHWERRSAPVMRADQPWEAPSLYCPHVLWDEASQQYRMWYSGGDNWECDAIGYATSYDGLRWYKYDRNPIFRKSDQYWDAYKTEACNVLIADGWHYMFYLGISPDRTYGIGLARSRDGVTGWERHPDNPIISGTDEHWDPFGICKPTVIRTPKGYLMWYNGTNHAEKMGAQLEELGLAVHPGHALWPEPGAAPERSLPVRHVGIDDWYLGE